MRHTLIDLPGLFAQLHAYLKADSILCVHAVVMMDHWPQAFWDILAQKVPAEVG